MAVPTVVSIGISVNDFPTEIIEMFAPDYSTSTLIILRSVNKRFYSVFSQDKFWKPYLFYSEKQYLCDLRSGSTLKGVKDVLEDIVQGKISRVHGYYRLQIAHIENWLCGPTQSFDIIDLPPSAVTSMEEIVYANEWWLFLSVDENIHIWNLTGKPYHLQPATVGPHSNFKIIPGVKVITFNKNDGLVTVYKFEESKLSLHNKFVYYMNSSLDSLQQQTSRCSFNFIVIGSYFIGYNRKISSYQGNLLHVWDLDSCVKKASISLSELDHENEFQSFVLDYSTEHKDIKQSCRGCKIDLYPGVYPNVVISLRYPSDRLSVVSIFNMELLQVTHFIDTLTSNIISCSINCNIVSVVADSHVINFGIRTITQEVPFTYGSQLTFIECENRNKNNILFKNSKMLIKYSNKVDIVSLVSETFSTKTIEVDSNLSILAFLEPNLLLMYEFKNPTKTDVKVYYIPTGREIFTWKNVNLGHHKFKDYYWQLSYASKLLLNFNDDNFQVLNF